MARTTRNDADYFPFICKDGKTLFILETKYQCKGTGFFTNVLRFLSMQPDHHICIKDKSDKLYFFSKTKCDEESGIDMLNIMAETGKIDNDLWKQEIIVSEAHLKSIKDAYRNRKNEIITIDKIREKYQTSVRNSLKSVSYTQDIDETSASYTQKRKEKKRKEKNRKEENSSLSGKPDHAHEEIINDLNKKANTNYRHTTTKVKELINARFKEGFTVDNFKTVHTNMVNAWTGTKQATYIRPQTLYTGNFDSYLNYIKPVDKPKESIFV